MAGRRAERVERCLEALEDTKRVAWEDRERYIVELQETFAQLNARELPQDLQRRLRRPLEAQMKDLRSAIVREACKLVVVCVETWGSEFAKTAMSLLPTLLDLVASGNKVIASYVDQCCCELFARLRMSSGLPRLLQLLRESKSKDIRESCMSYLLIALRTWSTRSLGRHLHAIEDLMVQVLRDASSTVRERARDCFIAFEHHFPDNAKAVLHRSDDRTQRSLIKAMQNQSETDKQDAVEKVQREQDSFQNYQQKERQQQQPKQRSMARQHQVEPAQKSTFRDDDQLEHEEGDEEELDKEVYESLVVQVPPPVHPVATENLPPSSAGREGRLRSPKSAPTKVSMPTKTQLSSKTAKPVTISSVQHLVKAHREFLNESIEEIAQELEVLKSFERLAKNQPDDAVIDCSEFVTFIKSRVPAKYDRLTALEQQLKISFNA